MQTIGLDLGFRQVKASSTEDFKFDSVIGYPSAMEVSDDRDSRHPLEKIVIDDGEERLYVGQKALRETKNAQLTFAADKTDHKSDRIKLLSALGYSMGDKEHETFNMITGLPVDELGIEGLKDRLISNMTKTFQFRFNGQSKTASIEKCNVIAQSAGAYYDSILDGHGNVVESAIQPKTVVIDIGFRTTDVVCMENARYNPAESFTVYTGVHNIHLELRKILLKQYRVQKQPSEVDEIARKRYITLNGSQVPIAKSLHEATRPFAEKILSEFALYIPNLNEVDLFLLSGGGASLMQDFFRQQLTAPMQTVTDAEMANARGYHKYLLLLQKNGM